MDKTSSSIVHGLLAQFSKKYDSCLVSVNLRKFLWMVDDGQRKLSGKQQLLDSFCPSMLLHKVNLTFSFSLHIESVILRNFLPYTTFNDI